MAPCIEEVLEERKVMWGEYHPIKKGKSMVVVRDVGCVFVSAKRGQAGIDEVQQYMDDNAHRYAGTRPNNRGRNPEVSV